MFFAMVILFATANGDHHTGVSFFESKAACEAAKPDVTASLILNKGAIEVGLSCTDAIKVGKVS